MNKAWLLLLLLLPLLFLSACTEKDEDYPNLLEPLLTPERDFYLLIEQYTEDSDPSPDIYLKVVGKELCDAIKVNGHIFPRDSYSYNVGMGYFGMGYYSVEFDDDDADWMILDENERMLSYEIVFPNRSITGTIRVPDPINVSFPDFNLLQDYNLSWTMAENPDFFNYDFYIRDMDYNGISSYGNWEKEVRSHIWPKEIWKDLSTFSRTATQFTANNYKYEHKGMIWVMRTSKRSQDKSKSSPPHTPFAPFEQLMKGELSIPSRK